MNFTRIISVFVASLALSSFIAVAQPARPPFPGERPDGMPQREKLTAKQRAERRTDRMSEVLNLDQKQYKKIYKIYLKEENARDAAMPTDFPMGPPPGGFPGGFPGGGFPGGPPAGMPFPGGFGEPQRPQVGGKDIDSDEYMDARDEKFRKILTPEQYSAWQNIERTDRYDR